MQTRFRTLLLAGAASLAMSGAAPRGAACMPIRVNASAVVGPKVLVRSTTSMAGAGVISSPLIADFSLEVRERTDDSTLLIIQMFVKSQLHMNELKASGSVGL